MWNLHIFFRSCAPFDLMPMDMFLFVILCHFSLWLARVIFDNTRVMTFNFNVLFTRTSVCHSNVLVIGGSLAFAHLIAWSSCAQEAHKAIPRGTLLANAICTLTYMLVAWICAFSVERDVLRVSAATSASTTATITTSSSSYSYLSSTNASALDATTRAEWVTATGPASACAPGERCHFGLLHSSQVRHEMFCWR